MSVPPQPPDQQVPKAQDLCHLTALGQQVSVHRALMEPMLAQASAVIQEASVAPLYSEDKRPIVFA